MQKQQQKTCTHNIRVQDFSEKYKINEDVTCEHFFLVRYYNQLS